MKQLINLSFALIFSYAFYQTHFIIGTDLFHCGSHCQKFIYGTDAIKQFIHNVKLRLNSVFLTVFNTILIDNDLTESLQIVIFLEISFFFSFFLVI